MAWRDALYFALLAACMLLVGFFALLRVVSEPRAASVGDVMAARLGALREAYLTLPEPQRLGYLQDVAGAQAAGLMLDHPARWGLRDPDSVMAQSVVRQIRTLLPDAILGFSGGEHPQVWFALPAPDGDLYWIRIPVPPMPDDPLVVVAGGSAALALVVVLGMLFLGWRSRDEIRQAARELRELAARIGCTGPASAASTALQPGHSLDELVRSMSTRLGQMHRDCGRAVQPVAVELRRAVAAWTACPDALARDARACAIVMQLERVARQFELFAHDWAHEASVPADLGSLVERVVARTSPGVTLALAPLPPLLLRPQAMEQLLAQLIDNALSHGGGRVVVTAAQEGETLVLRVIDRGDPVDSDALQLIGRPFYRSDAAREAGLGAGLGVALARHIAHLHGGQLQLARRIGGGLAVELRLPAVPAETPAPQPDRTDVTGRRPAWIGVLGDVMLLVTLFTGAIALSFNLFGRIVVPKYIDSAVSVMAGEIRGISDAHSALLPALRPAYLRALERYSEGRVRVSDPSGFQLGAARWTTFRVFVDRLRGQLPGMQIHLTPWPRSLLWIGLPAEDEAVRWLAISGRPYASGIWPMAVILGALLLASACFLVMRARRRLAQGVFASSATGERHDETGRPGAPSMERDMEDLRRRLDEVGGSLVQAQSEQQALRHRLLGELRGHLAALRDAGTGVPLPAPALEAMSGAVQRLDQLVRQESSLALRKPPGDAAGAGSVRRV